MKKKRRGRQRLHLTNRQKLKPALRYAIGCGVVGVVVFSVLFVFNNIGISTKALASAPGNDLQSGALNISDLINNCSANAAYTSIGATADLSAGACAPNGPNYNTWFKITATSTTFIDVQMKTGGVLGTMQYGWVTLWDSALNQLSCSPYNSQQYGTMEASYLGLTAGGTYYISVDNYTGVGYRGTFTLCVSDVVDYNYKTGAMDVTSLLNSCSANAAYTTLGASADRAAGSCAANGPNYNRWFKFTATATTFIDVQLKTGGALGTMQYGWVTLWDSSLTRLDCSPYNSQQYGTMEASYLGLTDGGTYYISVDNYTGVGYRGTFSLCLSDVVDYNYKTGAMDVTSLLYSCSANAAYTTMGASADRASGSCAANGPNYNRWFKFTATATTFIDVQLKTGGALGTMQYSWVTLWDSSLTRLDCSPYNSQQYGVMEASYLGLTAGGTYYISVDNYTGVGYRGTFSLCLSDVVDYNYKTGAMDVTSLLNSCSANAAYTTLGASADRAAGSCAANGPNYNRWFKFTATSTTFIDVQLKTGGALGTMQYGWVTLWDSSLTQLGCSPYNSQQYGVMEASYLGLTVGSTYYISVDHYTGVGYRGTFTLCVSDVVDYNYKTGAMDVTSLLNSCSANAAYTTLGASADQTKGSCAANGPNYNRWFKFTATSTTFIDVQLKTGGALGTMQYGWVTLWDSSLTQLGCSPYNSQQYGTMEASYLGLTAGRTYYISVDNYTGVGYRGTFSLCLSDVVDYNYRQGAIEFTDFSNWTSANAAYSTVSATPDQLKGSCWTNGPNNNRWFKFTATASIITVDLLIAGSYGTLRNPFLAIFDSSMSQIACAKYTSAASSISVNPTTLVVGHLYYISVDNFVGYSGTFTIHINGGGALPIELVNFSAKKEKDKTVVRWETGSEVNNDYFTIERSEDGLNFYSIGKLPGAGNSTVNLQYSFDDESPVDGTSYYRLTQTDFDGHFVIFPPVVLKNETGDDKLKIYSVSPNPFNEKLEVRFFSPGLSSIQLIMYGSNGIIVRQENIDASVGSNTFELNNTETLKPGLYFLKLTEGDQFTESVKLIRK